MKYYNLILLLVVCAACSEKKESKKIEQPGKPQYELAVVKKGGVSNSVKLPGELAAYQEVNIFPKVNGYVRDVMVDIGTKVTKGTRLMTLEAPEVEQDVLQAKEKYTKTASDLAIDKEHYQRLLQASRTPGAISPWDLSSVKSKVEADNALCNAAKANWQLQQTMQGYLLVTAPFNGVITERNVHPGVLVDAAEKAKPMLELKQTDVLRLKVDIPESITANIHNKDTVCFSVNAFPGRKMKGVIDRRADNVNSIYRNERVEVDVNNKDGLLTPGMYADVFVYTNGDEEAFQVPRSAVVTSTERKYVLKYDNGKITKVDVYTGNENINTVQVYGELHVNDVIISKANDEIEETEL
jgi:membrane fusion protein (multidrug efflux system)